MSYNRDEYREAMKAVKESVQEMDNALDGLYFEHGPNGISDRAEIYLADLTAALEEALVAKDKVNELIINYREKEK